MIFDTFEKTYSSFTSAFNSVTNPPVVFQDFLYVNFFSLNFKSFNARFQCFS